MRPPSSKVVNGICSLAFLLSCAHLSAGQGTDKHTQQVYEWLLKHQSPVSGIMGNQEYDHFSGVYSNALAALCFTRQGDLERAGKILRFFDRHFLQEFATGTPGGFHQFWSSSHTVYDKTVYSGTDRWIGDNAWLLIALNYHRRKTGSQEFDRMRRGIAEWLISLQDEEGGIQAGFNRKGRMTHKSTEGNLDSYAALEDYPEVRERIKEYLMTHLWVEKDRRFMMGSTVRESGLDCIAWAIAAFGKEFATTLGYAERRFIRTAKSDAKRRKITGFSDFVDKDRVWLEGTGQMAVAYNVVGDRKTAKRYIKQLQRAMVSSERFEGTRGLPCFTNDPTWEGASKMIFVPAQSWYLFAKWDFNPLDTDRK